MKWLKIRIKTTTEAEDIMVSDMCDIGLEGAQIEDNVPLTAREKEQMFVDILPDGPKDDGTAYLNFFVEIGEDGELKMGESLLHPEAASVISACIESTDADNTGVDRKDICSKEELLRRIDDVIKEEKQYVNVGDGTVTCEETADIDWINNWKNYFHQFYIVALCRFIFHLTTILCISFQYVLCLKNFLYRLHQFFHIACFKQFSGFTRLN